MRGENDCSVRPMKLPPSLYFVRRFHVPEPTNLPAANGYIDDGCEQRPYGHKGSEKRTYVGKRR